MKYPAPDFIAEILSPSTDERDRGIKFEDYAAHGVGEYWLLDPVIKVNSISWPATNKIPVPSFNHVVRRWRKVQKNEVR